MIANLIGGAAVSGRTQQNILSDYRGIVDNAPANARLALLRSDIDTYNNVELGNTDTLFLLNLGDKTAANTRLGVGREGYSSVLRDEGFATNPAFTDTPAPKANPDLAAGGVYAANISESETRHFGVSFVKASNGATYEVSKENLARGEVLYLQDLPEIVSTIVNGVGIQLPGGGPQFARINEGSVAELRIVSRSMGNDTHTFTLDGLDAGSDDGEAADIRVSDFASKVFVDDGEYQLVYEVFDGGDTVSKTIPLIVDNLAPEITTFTASKISVYEGDTINLSLSARDAGAQDTLSFLINGVLRGQAVGSGGVFLPNQPILNDGVFTFNASVLDNDGGIVNADAIEIVAQNVAPTITHAELISSLGTSANSGFTIDIFGDSIVELGSDASDPGAFDFLRFEWDLDDDGITDFNSRNGTFDFASLFNIDDAGTEQMARLFVYDDDDVSMTQIAFNIAPVPVPVPVPGAVLLIVAPALIILARGRRQRSTSARR